MKSAIPFIAIAACFFVKAGCSSQTKEFTEKRLVIASEKTVKVRELDLSITNNGCGRMSIVENGKSARERAYCGLVIKMKDTTIHFGSDFKPVYIGNIEIVLDEINLRGSEDSIPQGGCRVWVRKIASR